MSESLLYTGQNLGKDCVVGNQTMNRYAIFNGLEYPRRIDDNLSATKLGVDAANNPSVFVPDGAGGSLTADSWYAYRVVYASAIYLRPVSVLDGSGAYTRGNPSPIVAVQLGAGDTKVKLTVDVSAQEGMTHTLIYRSLSNTTRADAIAGPFYYVGKVSAAGDFTDTLADGSVGQAVETDNFPPNAYRYAVEANGYIFAGGNFPLGDGLTCTLTPGSSLVSISEEWIYDGVSGWSFKALSDSVGGVNGAGLYYANRYNSNTIQLIDANGDPLTYDGSLSGSGHKFTLYLPGYALRWCKYNEPEAWPTLNLINFEGDIIGIAQMPNQSVLVVCTDEPATYVLDLTQVGTYAFKTNKRKISTEYAVSSHYSLVPTEGRLRGVDSHAGAIIEINGVSVNDITRPAIPRIFRHLDEDENRIKNWHCAYDPKSHMFEAFVGLRGSHRVCDFGICQNTITGSWFFNLEKDLLSTGMYQDPETGEVMVLGGTEGFGSYGGRWGRILCPTVYDEWVPSGTLRSGDITDILGTLSFEVDNSSNDLAEDLSGLWVLVCDDNGEYGQMGYIVSNTANTITCQSVIGGASSTAFAPSPTVGWKFYIGMIEMRWGPKRFDFDDPDVDKKVYDVYMTISDYDQSALPFIRIFEGLSQGYWKQLTLQEDKYPDGDANDTLHNKKDSKLTATPRWGLSVVDRSYGPTIFRSLTVVFSMEGQQQRRSG
jgi:hypothetical protein